MQDRRGEPLPWDIGKGFLILRTENVVTLLDSKVFHALSMMFGCLPKLRQGTAMRHHSTSFDKAG